MQRFRELVDAQTWATGTRSTRQHLGVDYVDVRNIERDTLDNDHYRHVLYTTPDSQMQLVVMSLLPGESIPAEVHEHVTQFIRIERGKGELEVTSTIQRTGEQVSRLEELRDGSSFIIPAGVQHEVRNTSTKKKLKLYSIYTPAEHARNRIDWEQPQPQKSVSMPLSVALLPTDVKRKRNETDPYANLGMLPIEDILLEMWRKSENLDQMYGLAQASAAVHNVFEELKLGKSRQLQLPGETQKMGFFERIAKTYFHYVDQLPPDLQTRVDSGQIKYVDGAWFEHLERTRKWMKNLTLTFTPTYTHKERQTTMDRVRIKATSISINVTNYLYTTKEREHGADLPDSMLRNYIRTNDMSQSLLVKIFAYLKSKKQHTVELKLIINDVVVVHGYEVFGRFISSTKSPLEVIFNPSYLHHDEYFYIEDKVRWRLQMDRMLSTDPLRWDAENIILPPIFFTLSIQCSVDWYLMTPSVSSWIAEKVEK